MSEFQYYAFRAVDRQLTAGERSELRELSSRARISPSEFVKAAVHLLSEDERLDFLVRLHDGEGPL